MTDGSAELREKIRHLQERNDLFWKIIGDGPGPDDNLLLLVKDLRNAMMCGIDGDIFCMTKDVRFLRELLDEPV